jgi:anthranilate synthase component 1
LALVAPTERWHYAALSTETHIETIELQPDTLLQLATRWPERYPVFLDSAADGALSQLSILAAMPTGCLWLDARKGLQGSGNLTSYATEPAVGFLVALERAWKATADAHPRHASHLPFTGGWVAYLGYELAAEVEPSLKPHWPRANAADERPIAVALRVPVVLTRDVLGRGQLIAEAGTRSADLARVHEDLRLVRTTAISTPPTLGITPIEELPEAFIKRVESAQDYIRAGDIYQANLSRPWRATLPSGVTAAALYRRLRVANPSPFAAFAQFGSFAILSSSPERLLRIRGNRVDTRPIAGTHPRGSTAENDQALAEAMIAHPKERAEHVMLIDLARNDLGRVCVGGSVRVDDYMAVETYAHVHHIVSNVTGELRPGVTPIQALRAVFPGGTITGCPKVRCMQIIAELEAQPRGPYTGSLGYLNHDGSGDFNILIRTMSLLGQQLEFRAGAGIVADSRPQRELEETRAKARGMTLALA